MSAVLVEAELQTACGATRLAWVPYPVPADVWVSLPDDGLRRFVFDAARHVVQRTETDLGHITVSGPVYVYREVCRPSA